MPLKSILFACKSGKDWTSLRLAQVGPIYLRESDKPTAFIEHTPTLTSDQFNVRRNAGQLSLDTGVYCVHLDTGRREAIG